jgi:hypothetical protein
MQGPRITAVERMRSVVACRTVRNGTEGGSRDQNPTAILMLDRVQLETGGVGKESLDMARGRSHFPSTIKHLCCFMFWAISSDQTCTEIAGEPISRECRSRWLAAKFRSRQFALQKFEPPTPTRKARPNLLPSFAKRSHKVLNNRPNPLSHLPVIRPARPKSLAYPEREDSAVEQTLSLQCPDFIRTPDTVSKEGQEQNAHA